MHCYILFELSVGTPDFIIKIKKATQSHAIRRHYYKLKAKENSKSYTSLQL